MPRLDKKKAEPATVTIENARLIYRNFTGRAARFNREGDRNVCVCLDDDVAEAMAADGWNVKRLKARDEDGLPEQAYIQVAVKYTYRPPRIILLTSRGRTHLDEDHVDMLDYADIENVDLIIKASEYNVNGNQGVKAYLQSMYVQIREDELERKYADIDDLPTRSGRVDD